MIRNSLKNYLAQVVVGSQRATNKHLVLRFNDTVRLGGSEHTQFSDRYWSGSVVPDFFVISAFFLGKTFLYYSSSTSSKRQICSLPFFDNYRRMVAWYFTPRPSTQVSFVQVVSTISTFVPYNHVTILVTFYRIPKSCQRLDLFFHSCTSQVQDFVV